MPRPRLNGLNGKFAVVGKVPRLYRGFLQLIDLTVNRIERLGIGGSKILAACHRSDFLQRVLIDVDLRPLNLALAGKWSLNWNRRPATRTDADRVDFHAHRLGQLGSLGRIEVAG